MIKLFLLQEELSNYAKGISHGHVPKLNEVCIARFADGNWYRAACVDVSPNAKETLFTCIQVDYGYIDKIDIPFIRRIPKRFVEFLPFQAHHAILEGFETIEIVSKELVVRLAEILPTNSVRTVNIVRRHDDHVAFVVRIPDVNLP